MSFTFAITGSLKIRIRSAALPSRRSACGSRFPESEALSTYPTGCDGIVIKSVSKVSRQYFPSLRRVEYSFT